MTQELFAVSGCVLAHGAGSTITGGAFIITSTPSTKVLAGTGVYKTPLAFTFSGGSAPGFVAGSVVGGGSIPATSTKNLAESLAVMREGDSVTMNATGTLPPPGGGTGPIAGPVEISSAGQVKAKGE